MESHRWELESPHEPGEAQAESVRAPRLPVAVEYEVIIRATHTKPLEALLLLATVAPKSLNGKRRQDYGAPRAFRLRLLKAKIDPFFLRVVRVAHFHPLYGSHHAHAGGDEINVLPTKREELTATEPAADC
ncbi:MAG: hypothetical protein WCC84_08965 [Candidatus Cybelea sp.]